MILIEHPESGEKQVVSSLDGYDGWTVIAENVAAPKDDEEWDGQTKKWKLNKEKNDERKRQADGRDLGKLLKRIEALELQVSQLKSEGKLS